MSVISRFNKPQEPAIEGRDALRLLSAPGPHRVMRGDLAIIGRPGVVFTPEQGSGLPAVAFAHDWLTGVDRYRRLFEHLASWGIVVIAPNTERGPIPSHLDLANDLLTSLEVATGIRLGNGEISVRGDRLGLVGHGMGAGSAVIAAGRRDVATVAALYPAPTAPAAEDIAPSIAAPGLVVAGAEDLDAERCNARELAAAWGTAAGGGDVRLCVVDGASQRGIVEGRHLLKAFGAGKQEPKTIKTTKALLTGYLLSTLTGASKYRAFVDDEQAAIPRVTLLDRFAEPEPEAPPSKLQIARALLGR